MPIGLNSNGLAQAPAQDTGAAMVPADDARHILLVDDDRRIRELLGRYLKEHGYRVTTAESADRARAYMHGLAFDLLILDVMMPGQSGLDFARTLRRQSNVAILMLTARAETEHRIEGLETGVDDYLSKPFEPRELLLRIANILRRRELKSEEMTSEIIRIGQLTFNLASGELASGSVTVHLTERERNLLRVLCTNAGETVSRLDLADAGVTGSERAVDVQINRLRRKIEKDPGNPVVLQTVRGVGYKLFAR